MTTATIRLNRLRRRTGDGYAEAVEGVGEIEGGGVTERHFMSKRGRVKNVGIWPRQRAARELGLSGRIRRDWIEMSWSGTLSLSLSHIHT